MPLFSRKRSAFSFKRDANGAYNIKDDKSAHRDFKFTSNPFMGTSMTYQTDGEPRKPTAHTTPMSSPPTLAPIHPPPTRRGTASSIFDAYNIPSSPGPSHDLEVRNHAELASSELISDSSVVQQHPSSPAIDTTHTSLADFFACGGTSSPITTLPWRLWLL
ncbi:hypothetical protein FA13DRAFT_1804037 [Coprinellus micaceus]|uniref:Uncharacterized protein n=1 Tax=Coprinellus micaceus TaxID=71717 RepID=A0A4Y7S9P7_COPMI|nr:hypothetical protein FA13DRAFT_1804037 [Coprinellus micaceus]